MQRLKRVFKKDIQNCEFCGGAVKVIASIGVPIVINQTLEHLDRQAQATPLSVRPFARVLLQYALPDLKEPS